ncbi:cuticlin-4 isoform X1 [Schistocerca gregaria]|uniref:cuticlin-4 isoform X1 n=2 Tax=Schistocerca gregaria TaxID=7010 RepID=UPI00211DC137|nr:cuticlin-4 isoform X1 [Schistocerca gregaria]
MSNAYSGMAIRRAVIFILAAALAPLSTGAQIPDTRAAKWNSDQDVRIECNSNEILVAIRTRTGAFNGMVYPRGLSKNSSCMAEFLQQPSPVRYKLPLRSCNTMSTELGDGGIEYFNTIVIQPHLKLVTNQGRGFHIRCRYQTKDKLISNNMNVSMVDATPLKAVAPMPGCTMKIFYGDPALKEVAENVKIGDPLTLVISIDEQNTYGLRVSDCLVRDGLGWGEQKLINSEGCPVDGEIMGEFEYNGSKTTASVHFQAHKFPYTASVYYQCNVQLCIKAGGGCNDLPPLCGRRGSRRRRAAKPKDAETGTPATIEVYSGLYVNEATDISKMDSFDDVSREKQEEDPNSICISQKHFAIGIAVAGLILMLAVIAAILILLARRRHRKDVSATGSSIYSGPYTNTAYSHSS